MNNRPAYKDVFNFLVKDLANFPSEIVEVTRHHNKDTLMVKVEKEEVFQSRLENFKKGVHWALVNRKVF